MRAPVEANTTNMRLPTSPAFIIAHVWEENGGKPKLLAGQASCAERSLSTKSLNAGASHPAIQHPYPGHERVHETASLDVSSNQKGTCSMSQDESHAGSPSCMPNRLVFRVVIIRLRLPHRVRVKQVETRIVSSPSPHFLSSWTSHTSW